MLDTKTVELIIRMLSLDPKHIGDRENFKHFIRNDPHAARLESIMQQTKDALMQQWLDFTEPKPVELPVFDPEGSTLSFDEAMVENSNVRSEPSSAEPYLSDFSSPESVPNPLPLTASTPSGADATVTEPDTDTQAVAATVLPAISPSVSTANQAQSSSTVSEQALTKPAQTSPSGPIQQLEPNLSFRLDNGKVGVAYASALVVTTANAPVIEITGIDFPDELGLSFDPKTQQISGMPRKEGDIEIALRYSVKGSYSSASGTALLTINPDPKSLWKILPADPQGLFWKPDEDKALVRTPELIMVGASKRGRSHAHVGSFRDDDFSLAHVAAGGWHIAVISDGAGSAKYSRRGAELICREGSKRLEQLLAGEDGAKLTEAVSACHAAAAENEELAVRQVKTALFTTLGYAVHHATKRLQDETQSEKSEEVTFKDFSSTALFAIVKQFDFGMFCAAYWVGDGAICALNRDGVPILLGQPDGGEYSGQTRFLNADMVTQEELYRRLHYAILPDFKALVLMTDGISDPFFETDAGLVNPARWAAFWSDLENVTGLEERSEHLEDRLLGWLDFWSAGNHDDRTLALIY
ncbi:MAG: protein phosphatase 2C domain-containing protein [Atribacterota bacterium]|jgi:hypothetical protein|nr:protein phosphatase 2C domain-containing protein [Atribacterota bacterium]